MTLAALNDWDVAQCDGDWEHQGGLTFQTIDTPGWSLTVQFDGMSHGFPDARPPEVRDSDDDWTGSPCEPATENARFGCSPNNLEAMVAAVLAGVEGVK